LWGLGSELFSEKKEQGYWPINRSRRPTPLSPRQSTVLPQRNQLRFQTLVAHAVVLSVFWSFQENGIRDFWFCRSLTFSAAAQSETHSRLIVIRRKRSHDSQKLFEGTVR
jgi:hypothetical protein